jgi:hypothetical protein
VGIANGQEPPIRSFSSTDFPVPGRPDTIRDNFAELAPALAQTFFIGDGRTGSGSGDIQRFLVPEGATRLFLGYADGLNLGRDGTVPPCCYGDNAGTITASFSVSGLPPDRMVAPDATSRGPLPVTSAEYKFAPLVDPDIIPNDPFNRMTEIWARVYRPSELDERPYPLIVFLHGNHRTCGSFDTAMGIRRDRSVQYSMSGQCTEVIDGIPYTIVVPNHEGYGYLAEQLAGATWLFPSMPTVALPQQLG